MEIYLLSLSTLQKESAQKTYIEKLVNHERRYIESIKSPKKRMTSLGGRLLLQYVARIHGVYSYHLSYGIDGKPFFSDVSDAYFNISHSNEYLILAWSQKKIGIDMEQVRDILPKFPERMLTTLDLSFFQKQKESERNNCFFDMWTRKESFVKLRGGSIFREAKEFSVSDGEQLLPFMEQHSVYFHTCHWKNYAISVCTMEEKACLSLQIVTLQEINP